MQHFPFPASIDARRFERTNLRLDLKNAKAGLVRPAVGENLLASYSNFRMQGLTNSYSKFELFEYSLDALFIICVSAREWRGSGT